MKIAAYVNASGEITNLYEQGLVCLYEAHAEGWYPTKEISLEMKKDMGFFAIRTALNALAAQLNDCRVFLSAEVHGLPYAILGKMGIHTWKSVGSLPEQLDFVAQRERDWAESLADADVDLADIPKPIAAGEPESGRYQIDLATVLEQNPKLISKEVLIPFMETTDFQALEIICDHQPKWFAAELARLHLCMEVTPMDAEQRQIKILVSPIQDGHPRPIATSCNLSACRSSCGCG